MNHFVVPEWLYVLLLTIGLTVITVLLVLRQQWRRLSKGLAQLEQKNDAVGRDLLNFLYGLYDVLSQLSVVGVSWQLSWFGREIQHEQGTKTAVAHRFVLSEQDAKLALVFYVRQSRWEQVFYDRLLLRHLKALCALDLALKMRQVSSFEQAVARYQMFLAHDLKNLAQMIVLWQKQVQSTPIDQAATALLRWQQIAPLIADRAELLAHRLSAPGESIVERASVFQQVSVLDVIERLQRWARVHQLVLLSEHAECADKLLIDWSLFDDAAFQLMRNYQQHARCDAPVLLRFSCEKSCVCFTFSHPDPVDESVFKRMQEPLWTSSENGLGLGLWQMGQVLQRMHAELSLHRDVQGVLCFVWHFPLSLPL